MAVPCGRCVGCRVERARQFAVRAVHEAALHDASSFLTLTYAKSPLSLVPRDLELFWKRLRRRFGYQRFSYIACGEYGERTGRPHYHACVFGLWPDDAVLHRRGEYPLYRSPSLESVWGHGHCPFGTVTFESAQYVAGYITQKVTGPEAVGYYQAVDPETGEIVPIEPEFMRSSRNPAIGLRWLDRFGDSDAWRHDQVVVAGAESKVPRYYDRKFAERRTDTELHRRKVRRIQRGNTPEARRNSTPERLAVSEAVLKSKLKLKAREFE